MVITRTSTIFLQRIRDLSDQSAWQEFDGRYRPLLMSVGRRLGLNAMDAEDAAQETLAAFLVDYRADRYQREMGRLRDWLAGIMSHKVRDAQRRLNRQHAMGSAPAGSLKLLEDKSVDVAMRQECRDARSHSRWLHLRMCFARSRNCIAGLWCIATSSRTIFSWTGKRG